MCDISCHKQPPVIGRLGPSILSSDLSDLHSQCRKLLQEGADYLHVDVMDGHFVPNITIGPPVIKCLCNRLQQQQQPQTLGAADTIVCDPTYPHSLPFIDAHMMVSAPRQWISAVADAGVAQYTFHAEACASHGLSDASQTTVASDNTAAIGDVIRHVREAGMKAGLALSPRTLVTDWLLEFLPQLDMLLVMTVEPGFGGQHFMAAMLEKVVKVRQLQPSLNISVDGGVNLDNVAECCRAGANMIVSGSAITSNRQIASADVITRMKSVIGEHFSSS